MSNKTKQCNVPKVPDTLNQEWLADFIKKDDSTQRRVWKSSFIVPALEKTSSDVLSSREMEIALSAHVSADKEFNSGIDKFFAENYPTTLKNAMKLAFGYYLDYRSDRKDCKPPHRQSKHPHFQSLLDLIERKIGFWDFHEICCSIKEFHDNLYKDVHDTWLKIKDICFEKALIAVNILYLKKFWQNLNDIPTDATLRRVSGNFLMCANDYLLRVRKHCQSVDDVFWNNIDVSNRKLIQYFSDLSNDRELLENINNHIEAISKWKGCRDGVCESFIFDPTFECDPKTQTSSYISEDDDLCDMKNAILPKYYHAISMGAIQEYIEDHKKHYPVFSDSGRNNIAYAYCVTSKILMTYFGVNGEFTYDNKKYNLIQHCCDAASFTGYTANIVVKDLHDFLPECPGKSFEEAFFYFCNLNIGLRRKNRFPIDIRPFSEFSDNYGVESHKVFSVNIKDDDPKIDLRLYNMFHYGQSDICVISPYIRAANEAGYLSILNRLKKSRSKSGTHEQKEEAKRVEDSISKYVRGFPAFADAKITTGYEFNSQGIKGEIDIAIYKDKTLILIEAKSTYGILFFDERLKHEKHLIYAGHQLDKAVNALKTAPGLLEEITGEANIKYDDLRVETMIISTSFEFDGQKFNGHVKRSLLELMIVCGGTAYPLIMLSPKIINKLIEKHHIDVNDPGTYNHPCVEDVEEMHKELELLMKDFVLFDNIDNPSVDDFLNVLNSNNMWEKVMPYWQEYV